jgi:hypothetical protein
VESLHDPEWVKWTAYMKRYDKEGNKSYMELKHHVCDKEDWDLFYKPRDNKKA